MHAVEGGLALIVDQPAGQPAQPASHAGQPSGGQPAAAAAAAAGDAGGAQAWRHQAGCCCCCCSRLSRWEVALEHRGRQPPRLVLCSGLTGRGKGGGGGSGQGRQVGPKPSTLQWAHRQAQGKVAHQQIAAHCPPPHQTTARPPRAPTHPCNSRGALPLRGTRRRAWWRHSWPHQQCPRTGRRRRRGQGAAAAWPRTGRTLQRAGAAGGWWVVAAAWPRSGRALQGQQGLTGGGSGMVSG